MKIISKYRDYYDYLQGVYGVDEKRVLDRRGGIRIPEHILSDGVRIIFCNLIICRIPENVYRDRYVRKTKRGRQNTYPNQYMQGEVTIKHGIRWSIQPYNNKIPRPTPAAIYWVYWGRQINEYPILSPIGFASIMPPEDAYKMLDEFVAYREPEVDTPPGDMIRFESKGFSKKTSFRH